MITITKKQIIDMVLETTIIVLVTIVSSCSTLYVTVYVPGLLTFTVFSTTSNLSVNEAVIVENTLQPVGKEFTIPGVDYIFTATTDGKISYKLSESRV
mgnify:CR=1 FL=1